MKKLERNLSIRTQGDDVKSLQAQLRRLGFSITDNDGTYGKSTRQAVTDFQTQQKLKVTGVVDAATLKQITAVIYAVVAEVGTNPPPPESTTLPLSTTLSQFVVSGQVRSEDGLPLPGLRVHAVHQALTGSIRLGEDITDTEGRYTIRYELLPNLVSIDLRLTVYDADGKSVSESNVIPKATPLEIVDLIVPSLAMNPYQVEGKVTSRTSSGVGGLRVVIVDKGVGSDLQLAQVTTDDGGAYQATFSDIYLRRRGKSQLDLQARVFVSNADNTFLGASDVHYNASLHETLNVLLEDNVAPALQSEHEVLTNALGDQFKGKLGDLQENDSRQDITYLANKTGWDARAVALAALADRFSTMTADPAGAPAIPQAFFYALFRAGLPTNPDSPILFHTDGKTLEAIWKQAAEQGLIAERLTAQIPQMVERFQAFSAKQLLTEPARVGASSLKEMLTISGLNDAQQAMFAQLYAANRTDMPAFWNVVGNTLGKDIATRLQVDGKLGFLTINNAPLMQKIRANAGAKGLTDPLQLAQMGYYRTRLWSQLLTADLPIPKEIPGDTPESKRANYAGYLAAQIRLSYPTVAIAQMVKSGELPLTGAATGVPDQVHAFLTAQQGQFEIGVQPVEQYVAKNKLQVSDEVVKQVKRLQRVYQITASDQAMIGLMQRGIDSAHQIVRYDKDTFVKSFAASVGGEDQAALTYNKSIQVHNAALNIALSYLNARTALPIGVHSPPNVLDPTPANAGDVIASATLERLFGSMDFCTCEQCRSILSPAAYLVDLLLFLNSDPDVWANSLSVWKHDHDEAPYPFTEPTAWQSFQNEWNAEHPGQPLPNTEISPFDVLMSRRPDIQNLPLSCENTNTALPYIDVVNETLEYFVASNNLSLDGYLGHDTNGIASEDLMASPQYVMDSAYMTLQNERFPMPLPFHQPLESLRRYFNKFEIPLSQAMEQLRKTDDLESGTNPYGWRDILMEEIGLSRGEYEILTDSQKVPLWRMYGFPNGTVDVQVVTDLSNAKQFTRRVGITYDDLIAILRTRFVNPNSDLIPKLERLGVPLTTLQALKNGTITDSCFDALLPTGTLAPNPAEYGGDIRAWVKNTNNYARIMSLILLTIPRESWTISKNYELGDCIVPTNPPHGSFLYYACTKAGTSGTSEPSWPTKPGNLLINDGTVEWICRKGSTDCNFDDWAFRYTDPGKLTQNIQPVEFVRLLRFIRLWKKLGWTIEQTDTAIGALYRSDMAPLDPGDIDTVAKLDTGFLILLPRLGILSQVMKQLNLNQDRDLPSLLACWSEIGTHGDHALYRQMFLNPIILTQDSVFKDNGYGEYLQDPSQTLLATNSVQKAMIAGTITANDVLTTTLNGLAIPYKVIATDTTIMILATSIVTALNATTTPDPMTGNPLNQVMSASSSSGVITIKALNPASSFTLSCSVSLGATEIYKTLNHEPALRGALNLASDEFSLIAHALGFDETTRLNLANISAIYRRGWLARNLQLSVQELLLLIRLTDLDPFAPPDPPNPSILRLIKLIQSFRDRSLKSAVALYLIWNQDLSGKSMPAPTQITELARTLRGDFAAIEDQFAALDDPNGDIARARMTLVYGSESSDAFFSLLDDTLVVDIDYTHSATTLEPAITAADPGIAYDNFRHWLSHRGLMTAAMQTALKSVGGVSLEFQKAVDALFDRSQEIQGLFFTRYPELKAPFDTAVIKPPEKRHSAFLEAFQPELARSRKRQQSLQRLSAAAGVDLAFTQTILNPESAPYPLHSGGDQNKPALDDVLALETLGLAAGAGIWNGQIEAPETGFYNFIIEADSGAIVTLTFDGQNLALTKNGNMRRNTSQLELKAGMLYQIKLEVQNMEKAPSLKWETPKRGREVIPARDLYSPAILEPFSNLYMRFLKAASLADALGLTAKELAYFATYPDYRIAGDDWLNSLTVNGDPAPNSAPVLLKPFKALLDFARIKEDFSPNDERLLDVLNDPFRATQGPESLLYTLTRWDPPSLDALLIQFGKITGSGSADHDALKSPDTFTRIYDAFGIVREMGILAGALIAATNNDPTTDMVRNLQSALRARYDAASWRNVLRPINDEMCTLQRDALVAYILHQMRSHAESTHIDTPEKLFEYFLMDVQMEPCMETSRIRHALSSIQLFIERCLMNLEPRVSTAAISPKQWEWMKRYRVWEANRKLYLFPENWLEPELRDDKSPFFREIESELLQSDITEDTAATALLNYLSKLEEVAKLEPCGIYHVPVNSVQPTGEVDHVVARTAGAHRKYYYRRYEYGYWTPWEQIKLDIEDNPIIPVVWKDRLLLFWLRILKQGPDAMQKPFSKDDTLNKLKLSDIKTDPPRMTVRAMLCWSEYFNGKWQTTKTSSIDLPTYYDTLSSSNFDRSALRLGVQAEGEALRIYIKDRTILPVFGFENQHLLQHRYLISWPGSFLLYNTHSLPIRGDDESYVSESLPTEPPSPQREFAGDYNDSLIFKYIDPDNQGTNRDVLEPQMPFQLVTPRHELKDAWNAPCFLEDRRNVFYVNSEQNRVWVDGHNDYGIPSRPGNVTLPKIPPLVERPGPRVPPKIWGNGGVIGPDRGVIDPAPMQRFVTEDAYIHQGLGTTSVVTYGDHEIGPSGSTMNL